jgi:AcrR family transcriptional regulator
MPRVVNREARRAAIVTAAAAAFAERGVAKTAVSDIVKAAGVAQGTFYLYFETKEDVILAVVERMAEAIFDGIAAQVRAGSSAVDRLLLLRDVLSDVSGAPDAAGLIDLMHSRENRALHDRMGEDLAPRLASIVRDIVEQGVAEEVFHVQDIDGAAWFVLGGLQSVELSGTAPADMPAGLANATGLVLRALGYEGPRP